jgi:anti-anti-sigma factor
MSLTIESISHPSHHLINLSGEVDTKTATSLMDALAELELAALLELRIDMADVAFLSSAGLRALLFAKQKMPYESRLVVIGANTAIVEVITKTGLTEAVTLVADISLLS